MKVRELMERLELFLVAGASGIDKEITGGYVGDLLSVVMANAKQNNIWLTVQSHVNIVAIGSLLNLSGIIVTEGAYVEEKTVEKANDEGIPIFATDYSSYEMIQKLIKMGIK